MANQIFNLDLNKNNAINPIIFGRLTDGNLRKITVNITNEGEPLDLTGYKVTFEGISGGKTKVFDSLGVNLLDATNGKFEYKFSKTAFSSTGAYKTAYFSIEKDGTRETTNDIQIIVNTVADITAQDAEVAITELNKTISLINQKYNELNGRVGVYENDIKTLETWMSGKKTEINNIISNANSTFNQKLTEIQGKLDATNQAIANGSFYSKSETDAKIATVNSSITTHANNKSNPHVVTASQVGAYNKDAVDSLIANAIKNVKLAINPVGTILSTLNSANPSTYLGGVWSRYGQGRTLVGVNESDTDFSTTGKTGGEKATKLSADQIPEDLKLTVSGVTAIGGTSSKLFSTGGGDYSTAGSIGEVKISNAKGIAHNNLQPFITVYFWRRTA
ncbi:phage baseplate protein [Lactococcus carnosus]|uniref:BppU family phage baseplate upper protein n=1 Tax=Pseudolactococcus carnosus TaxID=2749961 RepID=A0ABT0AQU7_9LACT|nr:BppU family phage baseplate upper protein [Lactococcus carnosus]MCJ1989021.1 BppU family phage baseplate upper protein [Lactococcus carnosus]